MNKRHGGETHCTATQHKSGIKMMKKTYNNDIQDIFWQE